MSKCFQAHIGLNRKCVCSGLYLECLVFSNYTFRDTFMIKTSQCLVFFKLLKFLNTTQCIIFRELSFRLSSHSTFPWSIPFSSLTIKAISKRPRPFTLPRLVHLLHDCKPPSQYKAGLMECNWVQEKDLSRNTSREGHPGVKWNASPAKAVVSV